MLLAVAVALPISTKLHRPNLVGNCDIKLIKCAKSANTDSCVLNFLSCSDINMTEFSVTKCAEELIDCAYEEENFDLCVPKYKKCNVTPERKRIRLRIGQIPGQIV